MIQHLVSTLEDSHTRHRHDEAHEIGKELNVLYLLLELQNALLPVKYRSRSLRLAFGVSNWSIGGIIIKLLGSLRSCFYCCHFHRCIQ
jgi:hypothetical protein